MTIRSFFNGQVGTYVIALEKNYIPRTVFYGLRPTPDANGLEISWNVKQDDIEQFRKEAQYTFFGGKDRTTITNETWKWEKDEILAQGPGWSLHNTEALCGTARPDGNDPLPAQVGVPRQQLEQRLDQG